MPTDSKLKRLENLLKAVDDTVTKEEFVKSFELVMGVVKNIKETNMREFGLIHEFMTKFSGKLQGDTSMTLAEMKKGMNELFVGEKLKGMETSMRGMIQEEMMKMHSKMDTHMSGVKSGIDGKHGRDGKRRKIRIKDA